MTMPCEKKRSLIYAREFLRDLMDPRKTPRVPREIRKEAYYRLKHYPADYEIEKLAKKCPEILGDEND